MGHHKHKAGSDPVSETPQQRNENQADSKQPGGGIGGREFGQVIEPMQAQMASGNEGLADSSAAKQSGHSGTKKSGGEKKRKAA